MRTSFASPLPPPNEDCLVCTTIYGLPFVDEVENSQALAGAPAGSCNVDGASAMQNDVWWCFSPFESCLASLSVDMDFDGRRSRPPEHYEERVTTFLRSQQATGFPTYISQTPSEDVFVAMNLASLPAVLVYDNDGEIAKVFVDAGETAGFTYQRDIIPLVSRLIDS